jgi:hypothetical protein
MACNRQRGSSSGAGRALTIQMMAAMTGPPNTSQRAVVVNCAVRSPVRSAARQAVAYVLQARIGPGL